MVFLFETESAVFSTFDVVFHRMAPGALQADVGGERIDLKRHAFDNEVKAVTLHQFEIKKNDLNDLWCIQVVLDV